MYNVLQKKIRASLSKYVNDELQGNIRGFTFPLGKLIELTYKPYCEASIHAHRGFEKNGLCPLNIQTLRDKLGLDSRELDRRSLGQRGIVIPDLSPLDEFLQGKGSTMIQNKLKNLYIIIIYLGENEEIIVASDFNQSQSGKTLSNLATSFLQFGGPKLLEPFTEYVKHIHKNKATYNPPVFDPQLPYEPDFHIILGGHVAVKEMKKAKQTKMNFASGRAGTSEDFIAELEIKQNGNILLYLKKNI
jgi:hypothetical protein